MNKPPQPAIVPISRARHAGRKWRPYADYGFARGRTLVPLVAAEVPVAAGSFPVVFITEGQGCHPVGLLALQAGRNLLVDAQGRWQGEYVPALLRAYPFALARNPDGQPVLCLDESALAQPDQDGQPLLLEDGSLAEFVRKTGEFLAQLDAQRKPTLAACAALAAKGCLKPLSLAADQPLVGPVPSGVLQVNERALAELPDADFLELRKAGALGLAYGQVASMHRFQMLARLKAQLDQSQQPDLSLLERDGTLRFDALS